MGFYLDGQYANERFTGENDEPDEKQPRDYSHIKIKTSCINPPIPMRHCDYSAVDDSTYDGPGCPIGFGPTATAAAIDLIEQIALHDDEDPLDIWLQICTAKG